MPLLFPIEQLKAAEQRILYRERTAAQWTVRASQTADSTFGEPITPLKTKAPKKAAVTGKTLCSACGHPRECHRQPRPAHPPLQPSTDMPCEINVGCDCQQFSVGGKPFRPRIAISEWTLCRSCGHARHSHCTKRKPGLVKRLEPGELPYRILQKPGGGAYPCKHFCLTDNTAQCTSTSCSHTSDGKEFCSCEKFVNPWLTPKKRATGGKSRVRKTVAASPKSTSTLSMSESGVAKPRRLAKRKPISSLAGICSRREPQPKVKLLRRKNEPLY